MTEDEAKTKWCPMISEAGDSQAGFGSNRGPTTSGVTNYNCIASDCMMWRWKGMEDNARQYINDHGHLCVESGVKGQGYCGLGGRP